ncbi:MAG: hypothetical protein QOE76_4243 [Frankiales bacterium]|nr:hypothetical protein [Frankiales bacterium]MDX6246520.1 hypothetical protein [Frankiales bacterium]
MKVPVLRRHRATALPGVIGIARLDRRTKNLTKRLRPGEIAVIDHLDIDRVSAEALVQCGVAAVVNVSASISGRYPNLGPEIIVAAGIPLLDDVGPEVFSVLRDGDRVRLDEGVLYVGNDQRIAVKGAIMSLEDVEAAMAEARAGLSVQIEAFAANTIEFLRKERDLLLDGIGVPDIRTVLENRQALLVVRGYHYREDLQALRPYIREYRPVLIGVDGGADALRDEGYKPDLIVGDMDSVSDATLQCGAELVVHAYPDGRAPGLARLQALGLEAVLFPAAGTSEDAAMLLADEKGAELIVAVGSHATLVEFLDKGRAGMASTFLTRLRVGGKLIDAKGVSRLYRSRIGTPSLLLLIVATLILFSVAIGISSVTPIYRDIIVDKWHTFSFWLSGLFR